MLGKKIKTLILLLFIIGFILLYISFEWNNIKDNYCNINEEIIYVTVTITVTPLPYIDIEDDEDINPSIISNWESSYYCLTNPDYSEICFYKNICYNYHENSIILLHPLYHKQYKEYIDPLYSYPQSENNYKNIIQINRKDLDKEFNFPLLDPNIQDINIIKQSPHSKELRNVIIDNNQYYIAFQYSINEYPTNRYDFIKDNIMLWEVQRLNDTFGEFFDYPSINNTFIVRNKVQKESWENDILNVFIPSHTNILFLDDIKHIVHDYQALCMKDVVIVGSKPQFFSGPSEGEVFKQRLYKSVSLEQPELRGWDRGQNYTPQVTIFQPNTLDGYIFNNLNDILSILNHYSLKYSIINGINNNMRLKELGELFKDTDVLITPHDVFEVNYYWLGAHVSVIEVFPSFIWNNRYEYHSKSLTLNYQAIRSWIKSEKLNEIIVPLREIEMAIIEAFDMQAISIRGRATELYINTNITFIENNWFNDEI